jgi:hypothetical protein
MRLASYWTTGAREKNREAQASDVGPVVEEGRVLVDSRVLVRIFEGE